MKRKVEDDYKIIIWATHFSKKEANKIGLAIIFCLIGIVLSLLVFGPQNRPTSYLMCAVLAGFGYFVVPRMVFKDKEKHNN